VAVLVRVGHRSYDWSDLDRVWGHNWACADGVHSRVGGSCRVPVCSHARSIETGTVREGDEVRRFFYANLAVEGLILAVCLATLWLSVAR
jgi:hypothetical protein